MISHATFPLSGSNWAFRKFDLWPNIDAYTTVPAPTYVLTGSLANRWQVARPVMLDAEHDGDMFFVSTDELKAYGAGHSYRAAYLELISMLVEQYDELLHYETILAPGLKQLLDTYRDLLLPL